MLRSALGHDAVLPRVLNPQSQQVSLSVVQWSALALATTPRLRWA